MAVAVRLFNLCALKFVYRTIGLHDIFYIQMSRIFWECWIFITYSLTHQHVSSGLLTLNRNLQTKFEWLRFASVKLMSGFSTSMIYSSFFFKKKNKIVMYLFESGSKSNWNVMRMGDDLTSVFKWLRMILLRCFILLLKNLDLKLKSMVVFFHVMKKKQLFWPKIVFRSWEENKIARTIFTM